MATIDRDEILTDASLWLPSNNLMTSGEMDTLLELVISMVGDDATKSPEVKCKFLEAVANNNISRATIQPSSVIKEVLGDHEVTYGKTEYLSMWNTFKDNLKNVCPLFGYSYKVRGGIRINPGEKYDPLDR